MSDKELMYDEYLTNIERLSNDDLVQWGMAILDPSDRKKSRVYRIFRAAVPSAIGERQPGSDTWYAAGTIFAQQRRYELANLIKETMPFAAALKHMVSLQEPDSNERGSWENTYKYIVKSMGNPRRRENVLDAIILSASHMFKAGVAIDKLQLIDDLLNWNEDVAKKWRSQYRSYRRS